MGTAYHAACAGDQGVTVGHTYFACRFGRGDMALWQVCHPAAERLGHDMRGGARLSEENSAMPGDILASV